MTVAHALPQGNAPPTMAVVTWEEALALLSLPAGADAIAVRQAYRNAALTTHPDRPGAPADAAARMARVNEAYAVLTGPPPPPPPLPPRAGTAASPAPIWADPPRWADTTVEVDHDGTLVIGAPAEEAFQLLLDAAEGVGDLTYVDRDAALAQIIVGGDGKPWAYATFSLQGRAGGTEVFVTVDSIDANPAPDAKPVVDAVAAALVKLRPGARRD
jgi:hypothetical protein